MDLRKGKDYRFIKAELTSKRIEAMVRYKIAGSEGQEPKKERKRGMFMKPIRIFIAEDDPMVSYLVGRIVHSLPDLLVAGSAATGFETLERIDVTPVDLVLLDVFMPGLDGFETLGDLRGRDVPLDVILITASADRARAEEALRRGVWDYIVKPFSYDRLRVSLEHYRDFHQFRENLPEKLSQEHLDRLFFREGREALSSLSTLSNGADIMERIVQILENAEGPLSAQEVADTIGVSRITVRKYCEAMVASGRLMSKNHHQTKGRPIKKYQIVG
jgi:response regulator of citrate/malate metabolism